MLRRLSLLKFRQRIFIWIFLFVINVVLHHTQSRSVDIFEFFLLVYWVFIMNKFLENMRPIKPLLFFDLRCLDQSFQISVEFRVIICSNLFMVLYLGNLTLIHIKEFICLGLADIYCVVKVYCLFRLINPCVGNTLSKLTHYDEYLVLQKLYYWFINNKTQILLS